MKKLGLLFLSGAIALGVGSLIATDDNEVEGIVEPVEEILIFDTEKEIESIDPKPIEEVQYDGKQDLFIALKEYGFDKEFLRGKEVVVVERDENGNYVPRYVSHDYKKKPFIIFDNGVMTCVSTIVFVLTTPLLYKLFHSSSYKEVLGDMFALVSAVTGGGCVAYLSGKLASEIYKNSGEKKTNTK